MAEELPPDLARAVELARNRRADSQVVSVMPKGRPFVITTYTLMTHAVPRPDAPHDGALWGIRRITMELRALEDGDTQVTTQADWLEQGVTLAVAAQHLIQLGIGVS